MSPHRLPIHRRLLPALASTVALVALLTACGPGSDPAPEDTGAATPTEEPTETATPEPTESEEPAGPTLSAADRDNIRAAIETGNTAAIEGYLSDPIRVILMSSECCFDITPTEAIESLMYVTDAPGPWNWSLPTATTDPWHTNQYYGYLFTDDDITGRAADGTIVNFGITGDRVTTILMGFEEGFTY